MMNSISAVINSFIERIPKYSICVNVVLVVIEHSSAIGPYTSIALIVRYKALVIYFF